MADVPVIREPATREEYRAGLATISAAWHAGFADIVSDDVLTWMDGLPNRALSDQTFDHLTCTGEPLVLVAVDGDAVVGTGSLVTDPGSTKSFVPATDDEIRTLYVHPERWREGIGTRLLNELCSACRPEANRVILETFRDNRRGCQFYESRGFDRIGSASFDIAGESYPTVVYAQQQ